MSCRRAPSAPATVTTAEAWLPHSRPKPAAPLIRVAALQDLDADILMKKSAAELCSLTPPHEAATERRAAAAHAWRGSRTLNSRQAKAGTAKAQPAKVAHAGPAAAMPDVHAVQ